MQEAQASDAEAASKRAQLRLDEQALAVERAKGMNFGDGSWPSCPLDWTMEDTSKVARSISAKEVTPARTASLLVQLMVTVNEFMAVVGEV